MTVTIEELVREIHARPVRMVIAVTGGGSQAIADLLRIPGGSRTVLEAIVPYSPAALAGFLKAKPENYCSARTARAMAMSAFWRARELATFDESHSPSSLEKQPEILEPEIMGIGCTASLASDRPKRGPHRVHIAVQTASFTETVSLELTKGVRDRAGEEKLSGELVLNQIGGASAALGRLSPLLDVHETLEVRRTDASPAWQALMLSMTRIVDARSTALESNERSKVDARGTAIFPGAFCPLHDGHRQIAAVAEKILGTPTAFEISIDNVDKPPLDYSEIAARVVQFAPPQRVWLTRAPTFVEKSRLFSGTTFLVGADTVMRIADPRYYGDDPIACRTALREIADNGCRFLVYGRVVGDKFIALADLALPAELQAICRAIPGDLFRMDISSTEIRRHTSHDD